MQIKKQECSDGIKGGVVINGGEGSSQKGDIYDSINVFDDWVLHSNKNDDFFIKK